MFIIKLTICLYCEKNFFMFIVFVQLFCTIHLYFANRILQNRHKCTAFRAYTQIYKVLFRVFAHISSKSAQFLHFIFKKFARLAKKS